MFGRTRRARKRSIGCVTGLLTAALLSAHGMPLLAVESDRDNSIRSVRVSDGQIAESTLIIGSFMIELAGLSDHIYEIAQDSVSEFSQNKRYYKSELAGGQWFEITDAVSIRDITNAGTPVSTDVIEALEFTHRVAADGTVTDLRVQAAVNEFDIPDPYDLMNMEELRPIRMRYEFLQSKETRTESDEKYLEIMEIFYGLSIEDDITRDCDTSLDALHPYKTDVAGRGQPGSWTEAVTTVMEGEDARRRVQSLNTLDVYLDELLKKAGGQDQEGLSPEEMDAFYDAVYGNDGEDETEEGENWFGKWRDRKESYQKFLAGQGTYRGVWLDENFQTDTDMISAIGDAKSNVRTSISKYTGKLLLEGTMASSQAVYRYSTDLIRCARAGDTGSCDGATARLVDLLHILESVIENADSERASLEEELVDQAFLVWQKILSGGAGQAYRQAQGEGADQPALTAFLEQRGTDADSARLEYQTMLTEMWKRMENSLAQADAQERIGGITQLEALPPGDEAQGKLLGTVDRHLEWLRKSLASLIAASGDSSALDRLLEEQRTLERQRLNALDDNDLAEAKRLSAEMDAKQNDIDGLNEKLSRTLADPDSSAAEKTKAAAGMAEGSAGRLIGELAEGITAGLRNGTVDTDGGQGGTGGLENDMAALSELAQYDPDAASGAVLDIRDALDGASDSDNGLLDDLNGRLSEIEQKCNDGSEAGEALSEERLNSLLADYFDGSSTASGQDKAGALIALSQYAEDTDNQAAGMLAVSMANRFAAAENPYIFLKYDKAAGAYVSLQSIGRIFGYRYVFDDVHQSVTLQKSTEYYTFTLGNPVYGFAQDARGELSAGPVIRSVLYISSDDGNDIFGCKGYDVPGCSYAAARTKAMEPGIRKVYDMLVNAD